MKIKIRKTWGSLNPRTRIKESNKRYKRQKEKKELKKLLELTFEE